MSNLPPGCSPNDPHIVGYPERSVHKTCGADGVYVSAVETWIMDDLNRTIAFFDGIDTASRDYTTKVELSNYKARHVKILLESIRDHSKVVYVEECSWSGEVDTQYDGYAEWWE